MSDLQIICDIYSRCNKMGKKIALDAMKSIASKQKLCEPALSKALVDRQIDEVLKMVNENDR